MATRNAATSQQPAECEKRGAISLPNSGRRLRLQRLKQRRGAASPDLVLDRILQPKIPTGNRNRSAAPTLQVGQIQQAKKWRIQHGVYGVSSPTTGVIY
uniref:Uncharacterized protein n=1 Tax=Oryza glumipatula TaxID=40148 RepID=A0A0E0B407_9ORYZ